MATHGEKFRKAVELVCLCNQDMIANYPVEKKWADVLKLVCEGYLEYYKERFK